MPAAIVACEGLEASIGFLLGQLEGLGCEFRLFSNNLTPDGDTLLAAFTEAAFAGYAPITLLTAAGYSTTACVATADDGNAYTWTSTGSTPGAEVYGWYLVDPADGRVVLSARFADAPLDFSGTAATVTLHFSYTLQPAP